MTSANLVATRGEPRLWVVAHLDTKSQRLSFVARSAAAAAAFVSLSAFVFGRLTDLSVLAVAGGVVCVASLLVLALSGHGDASPGANDNASGIAVLLALARRLKDEPTVGFLVPTGEEDGLVGSDRFVRAREGRRDRPFVVNVDTVGRSPLLVTGHRMRSRPRRGREASLHASIVRAASGVPHRLRAVPFPAAVDSFVFHRAGYPALTLAGGGIADTYRHLHRPTDTVDRVDGAWLVTVADVAERGIRDVLDEEAT